MRTHKLHMKTHRGLLSGLAADREVANRRVSEIRRQRRCRRSLLFLIFLLPIWVGIAAGHAGGDTGVRSEVRHFPDVGATIVLLANGGEDGVTGRLFNRLWDEAMLTALDDL